MKSKDFFSSPASFFKCILIGSHKLSQFSCFLSLLKMIARRQAAAILLLRRRLRKRNKFNRRVWVHEINQKRTQYGHYNNLHKELLRDPARFRNMYRMSILQFYDLLSLVNDQLMKFDTTFRPSLVPELRLAATLR